MLKPFFLRFALGLMLSLLFFEGAGQVDIVNEDMRSGSLPTGWTQTAVTFTTGAGGYANFTTSGAILTSPVIDLTPYTSVTLTFDVAEFGGGIDGPLIVEFSDDGGSTWTAQSFNSPSPSDAAYVTSGPTSISVTGSSVRFRFIRSSSPSGKRLRDVVLEGIEIGPPTVQFESTGVTISENGSFVELCVDIVNPDPITDTTVDIELTGTGSPHVNSYTTANLTFPAGSSDQQCVTITIADDLVCGNSQNYTFTLVNEGGPADVAIGSQNVFTLGITDDDSSSGTIVKQGFEEDATETFAFTNINGGISTGNDGSPNNQRIRSGSKSFQVNEQTSTLNFNMQDISSFTNVQLELWNSSISLNGAGNGADGGDFIRVYVSETATFSSTPNVSIEGNNNAKYGMNGNLVLNVTAPATISHITPSYGTLSLNDSPSKMVISIPDAWNSLYAKIEIINNTANEVWCLDDIRLSGITCDACVDPTITSINPTSGPKETVVNIIGTNFITGGALTDVQFGGVSASSYTVISDTELTAVVPADAATGVVKVVRGACNDISTDIFTFLEEDCETGTASLIISELCDPQSGYDTDRYIEIYNPSDVSVNLNGWTLYSLSNASNINNQSGISWSLSGMIGAGQAMTCGHSAPTNGGPHNFTDPLWNASIPEQGSSQWNGQGQDGAALYNGTTRVDAVLINPGSTGNIFENATLIRNADICDSNPDAPLSEWTKTSVITAGSGASTPRVHSSCVLLTGADPSVISASTPNISEPICNQPDLTITATSGSVISYQWYYNDGSASWTQIVDDAVFSGATTPTLSITNLIGLEYYQFYCRLITDLACINYSRAIQVDVLANDKIYFKSKSIGLWSDPTTWEFSDDLTIYSDACLYPTKANAELIEIETGQTVTFDLLDTDTLPSIWVLSGGTLQTQSNRNLIIDNVDPTAELIVEGTYIDNGTSGSSIDFLNGATWELASGGTIIKTNTSSSARYRDNYEGGISSIPAEGNWVYKRLGNNDLSVVSTGMFYPNLSFQNDFGATNYSTTNSLYIFSGSSASPVIKGNLEIGIEGSGQYTVRTTNSNANPIYVGGYLSIGVGSSFLNSAGSDVGTGIEVQGDMDIEGTLDLTAGTGAGIGILKFSGANDMIGVGTGTVIANHIIIDKDPGFQLYTELNFEVQESAEFLNGILELDNVTNVFTFQAGATTSGATNASYIDGRVRKTADFGENFTFPIGDSNADGDFYQPARIFGQSAQTTIDAQYFAEANPYAGAYYDGQSNNPYDNQEIGNCDYWQVDSISGADVQLALKFTNADPDYCNIINNPSILRIASLNAANNWDNTDSAPNADEIEMGVVIGTLATGGSYGVFAFQSSGLNLNVLPIKLTSFTATPENYKVQTAWTTETETNNAFFTVERSADARVFQEIGRVTGAGTSHTARHYTFTDERPLSGVSYYRLKQTDFDGHYSHSDIVAVSFTETTGFSLDLTYRAENELNLVYTAMSPYILVEIFDVLGKRVYTEVAENNGGRSVLSPNLGRGAYVVRISGGGKWDSGKIVW